MTITDHYRALTENVHMITKAKRDSARDLGVFLHLLSLSKGLCSDCGIEPATEFAHVMGTDARAVTVNGELVVTGMVTCRGCNDVHRAVCKALGTSGVLPLSYVLARPNMLVGSLPSRKELVAIAAPVQAARKARIESAVAAAIAAA